MARAGIRRGRASIDVTHGLRVQPFFLLVGLLYLRTLHPALEFGTAFYGARDLSSLHPKRWAPLYEQGGLLALLQWLEAAQAFTRYGDAAPVADLLKDSRARHFSHLSRAVQLNALRDLREDAGQLVSAYRRVPEGAPVPFDLLLPTLLELPRQLADAPTSWQAKLLLARKHVQAQNVGLGTLALWEAILDRVAQAYGIEERSPHGVSTALGAIAEAGPEPLRGFFQKNLPLFNTRVRAGVWKSWQAREGCYRPHFGQVADLLREIRNALAHADEGLNGAAFEIGDVFRLMQEGLIDYLGETLGHPAFDRIAAVYPDWRAAMRS